MVNFLKKSIKGIKSLLEVNTGIFFPATKILLLTHLNR